MPKQNKTHDFVENDQALEDDFIFTWYGPNYLKYARSWKWYLVAILIAIGFYAVALSERSLPMMFMVLAVVVVFYIHDQEHPEEVKITISSMGIRIGEKFYPYTRIESFYVEYHPPLRILHFKVGLHAKHTVGVPFPAELNPSHLREFLITQIPEQSEDEQSLLDYLLRILKF